MLKMASRKKYDVLFLWFVVAGMLIPDRGGVCGSPTNRPSETSEALATEALTTGAYTSNRSGSPTNRPSETSEALTTEALVTTGAYTGNRTAYCRAGYYSPTGHAPCKACTPGYYQPEKSKTNCKPCPAGSYQPGEAQTDCVLCTKGTFQTTAGEKSCERCPDNKPRTVQKGSDAITDCIQ
ncbi:uncharacterized protein [Amphiura filiformis]|uniref:uncharacterized protein n=1 Tax=Amphiura filiformis TaxID=82378 RepID=UPI003B212FD0